MSVIRAAGYGVGVAHLYGARFGIVFGILATAGQVFAYRIGIRPTIDGEAEPVRDLQQALGNQISNFWVLEHGEGRYVDYL